MSSISSLSSSTSGIYGGANRITGLASGLDTEALIEAMTSGTRSKIAKQNQQKQLIQWQMDAYRSISSKLIAFQNKYTSYSSSTNMRTESFFMKNLISAVGDNSKYISVSGVSSNASNISITSIKQLAQNANAVSNKSVSTGSLQGEIQGFETSKVAGTKLAISFGGSKTQTITLSENKSYDTVKELVDEINTQLGNATISTNDGSKKLSECMEAKVVDNKLVLQSKDSYSGTTFEIKEGTSQALLDAVGWEITPEDGASSSIQGSKDLTDKVMTTDLKNYIEWKDAVIGEGKKITLNYNGTSYDINMPSNWDSVKDKYGELNEESFKQYLQDQIDAKIGKDRVQVNVSADASLSFKTVYYDQDSKTVKEDKSSILEISSGSSDTLKALGLEQGDSNRVNLDKTLAESGLSTNSIDWEKATINGISIKSMVGDKDPNTMTVSQIIKAINESDANVNISYVKEADKFSITSTIDGAGGSIDLQGGAETLFGIDPSQIKDGVDAIVFVDYDGAGGADAVELRRSSNTIDIDGMTVSLKGTFNENNTDPTAAITFDAKVDTDKVTTAVKDMIDAFNEIIKSSNDEMSTKPNRDYAPLTDEQKEEMTEDQIEEWEKKAKEGMLFNSSELRSFTSEIRFIFSSDSKTIETLENMGITVSSTYSDHGKISFDEEKFKAFLEQDSDTVAELFAGTAETSANGQDGIMTKIYDVFDKYAGTTGATKGVFVEKAGAVESPLSMLQNTLQKEMDSIDDYIETLQSKLEDETERYYRKFTSLETYIQQMNSQSSWLTQQFSY